jgi:ribosomal 50S subunit-associated protein YjgA (DUF615 family)
MNDKRSLQNDDLIDEELYREPSKSAKKREMLALQALGQALAALSDKQFRKIEFPEDKLREALEAYRAIPDKKHEARRRQMQFIGKVMRGVESESLQAQLDAMEHTDNAEKRETSPSRASGVIDCLRNPKTRRPFWMRFKPMHSGSTN